MRKAFTLFELLAVITIMVILSTMTIGAIRYTIAEDKIRSAVSTLQAHLGGAKNQAFFNDETRGLRLLVDEDNPTIATGIVYVSPSGAGTFQEDRADLDHDADSTELTRYVQLPDHDALDALNVSHDHPLRRAIIGTNTRWTELAGRGVLNHQSRVTITAIDDSYRAEFRVDGRGLPIETEDSALSGVLTIPEQANGNNQDDELLYLLPTQTDTARINLPPQRPWDTERFRYEITLIPEASSGAEVVQFPKGTCIDLTTSEIPAWWITDSGRFSNTMDIMFSPLGTLYGNSEAEGIIRLHIRSSADALEGAPASLDDRWVTVHPYSGEIYVELP